jgi:hypothetical protein
MKNGKLNIQSKHISALNPAPYNPRYMTEKQRQGLENSMDEFGIVEPIVWNERSGNIVGGHQRFYKLQKDGIQETDVVVVDLDDRKEKALNIALNHKGISGEFDSLKLDALLEEISDEDYFTKLNLDEMLIPKFEDFEDIKDEDVVMNEGRLIITFPEYALKNDIREIVTNALEEKIGAKRFTVK